MGLVQQLLRGLRSRARAQPRRTQISRVSPMYSPELLRLPSPMVTPSRERVGVLCAGSAPGRDSRQPLTLQEGSLGWAWLPCPVACWETSCAGQEKEHSLLEQDMGWRYCSPPAPNPKTLSGHQGDAQASPFPQYPSPCPATVLPAWCSHLCPRGWDPDGQLIPGHLQPWLLLKSYSDCQVLGDSDCLPTQLSLSSPNPLCRQWHVPSDGDVLLSHI